jgi:hypothetical protein
LYLVDSKMKVFKFLSTSIHNQLQEIPPFSKLATTMKLENWSIHDGQLIFVGRPSNYLVTCDETGHYGTMNICKELHNLLAIKEILDMFLYGCSLCINFTEDDGQVTYRKFCNHSFHGSSRGNELF